MQAGIATVMQYIRNAIMQCIRCHKNSSHRVKAKEQAMT